MRLFELENKPTLYIDMDGVLCDFFGEWARGHGVAHYKQIDKNDIKASLDKIGTKAEEFFANLPKLPGADELLRAAQAFGGYTILSSPLERNEAASIKGKQEWIAKHLQAYPPKNIIFERNKAKYADAHGAKNLLVDDYGVNVRAWNEAGGEAFKHRSTNVAATLAWLKEHEDDAKRNAQANLPRSEPTMR
jgi:5'(3')-deoxyribonucleotidase